MALCLRVRLAGTVIRAPLPDSTEVEATLLAASLNVTGHTDQSSTERLGTRENSPVLLVTNVRPCEGDGCDEEVVAANEQAAPFKIIANTSIVPR